MNRMMVPTSIAQSKTNNRYSTLSLAIESDVGGTVADVVVAAEVILIATDDGTSVILPVPRDSGSARVSNKFPKNND